MSTTASTTGNRFFRSGSPEPQLARIYFWVVTLFFGATMLLVLPPHGQVFSAGWGAILAWICLIALADSVPIRSWGRITMAVSMPITLAVGLLYEPAVAAAIVFVASYDPRELSGEVTLARALYNRSQIAMSILAASFVFHLFGVSVTEWPIALLAALAALAVDVLVNTVLVVAPTTLSQGGSPYGVLRRVVEMSSSYQLLGYVALGMSSILIALVASAVGVAGAFLFVAPLVLARELFAQTSKLQESVALLEVRSRALVQSLEQIADERKDERMVVAGELHDEVLPPLFKVHLMGQVIRQDIDSGRLLDLDADLPELLSATDAAQVAVRELVGDLRKSSLGPGGLEGALRSLSSSLEAAGSPRIGLSLGAVEGSKLSQLLVYQVCREAMNNAARHSRGTTVRVSTRSEGDGIRVVVADDGVGFDSQAVDRSQHFGLQLISERVEAAGGRSSTHSILGTGTTVSAWIPNDLQK